MLHHKAQTTIQMSDAEEVLIAFLADVLYLIKPPEIWLK